MREAAPEIRDSEDLYQQGSRTAWYDDGREEALRQYVMSEQPADKLRNHPDAVVAAIDRYGQTQNFLMTLGQHKVKIIRHILETMNPKPKVIVELGGYIGYSAVAFGGMLKDLHQAGGSLDGVQVWSLELDPRWASITRDFLNLAGLNDVVTVVVGPAEQSLKALQAEGKLDQIDVLLVDHWEPCYVPDLQVCEKLGLLRVGSVVLADNVVTPGAPEYLEYLKGREGEAASGSQGGEVRYRSRGIDSMVPNGVEDMLEVSTVISI